MSINGRAWWLMIAAAVLTAGQLWGQAPQTKSGGAYTPPKTPWGDPDLQGQWPTTTRMALQRPLPGQSGDQGRPGNAQAAARANPEANAPVLIVDPPDGRMPPWTEEANKRRAEARDGRGFPAEWREEADTPEDMNLYYRCITRGVVGTMMYSSYNNGNQIIQAPGYVVIRQEMIHESRIIPLDRPHVSDSIRMYMGDSRGHWEGNTLVVETTNMTDKTSIGSNGAAYRGEGGRHSEALKLIERFTRTGPHTLQYEVKIDDPKSWSRPWTLKFSMDEDP